MTPTSLHSQKGQIMLIVVLVMVVSLTVGLSLGVRSITNLRSSTEEENSQRAFSAAEAGVEKFLKTTCTNPDGCVATGDFQADNDATFNAQAFPISGTDFLIHGGASLPQDDGADIWLIDHNTDESLNYTSGWQQASSDRYLTFYWGVSTNACNNPALEVILISGTQAAPRSTRYALDPCGARAATNSFTGATAGTYTILGKQFFYKTTITVSNASKGLLARVVPIYGQSPIGVKSCDTGNNNCNALPIQGKKIDSTGKAGSDTERRVTVYQGYPELPPELFHYILFATQ